MRKTESHQQGANDQPRAGGAAGVHQRTPGLIPAGYQLQPWDQYGLDVLEGRITVCRYTRLAVERHYRDLLDGASRGLVWRPDLAAHVLKFFPKRCKHSKGEWAGTPVELAPWQAFWLAVEFGWYRTDGRRRFRTWYEEVARKNGKSTKLAGLGIYLFACDKEGGAEVYTAATKLEQAKITHNEAVMMVGQDAGLRALITAHHDKLFIRGTSNKFLPLGADAQTQDGLNVHGAIIDELHAHPTRALWDVLDTARGARRNSIMHAITTAGFNRDGSICLEQRGYLIQILEGAITDDSFGGVIYTLDQDDDWRDESTWIKANPNLGVSIFLEELKDAARKAAAVPAALFNFLTKRLNIWTQAFDSWLSLDDWDQGSAPLDLEKLQGRRCFGGLDLSTKTDLTAWVLVFPPDATCSDWIVLPRFFVPEDNMQLRSRKDRVPYESWAREGWMMATPGNVVDQERIRQQVLEDAALFDLVEVGFDDWNSAKLATELMEAEINMVAIRQNFGDLSAPSKEVEALVKSGRLAHGGHPVLRWCAGNVVLLRDTNDNYRPAKNKSRERIDGIVALIMAMNRALFGGEEQITPGIIVL
ncbi:terminase large subunit [Chitinibacteraceae bacterium HSL-7]